MNTIPLMKPYYGKNEISELNNYLDNDGWLTEFKKTQEFENILSNYTQSKNVIVVTSGTASLILAALSLNLNHGDEVIIPNYTMIATPNAFKLVGAVPVFVDVEAETLCLDIQKVKKAITKKTKAIVLVAANGRYPTCGYKPFIELSRELGIHLIEDAAQALGSFYPDKKHIGTIGSVGCFSFSAFKIVTTGQGGACLTNNSEIANSIKKLKDFGRTNGGNDIHDTIGYNFKFTDIQACIGVQQMKNITERIRRKKEIYLLYKDLLSNIIEISFFNQDIENTTPWYVDILVNRDRDKLQNYLLQNKIQVRPMYPPINKQKAYDQNEELPVSTLVGAKGLWLPCYITLDNKDIEFICKKITDFFNQKR